jgi:hypothetical protein
LLSVLYIKNKKGGKIMNNSDKRISDLTWGDVAEKLVACSSIGTGTRREFASILLPIAHDVLRHLSIKNHKGERFKLNDILVDETHCYETVFSEIMWVVGDYIKKLELDDNLIVDIQEIADDCDRQIGPNRFVCIKCPACDITIDIEDPIFCFKCGEKL